MRTRSLLWETYVHIGFRGSAQVATYADRKQSRFT
jgi:hypothetical protein